MAGFGTGFTNIFSMSDAVWERHANPWSVWTRVASGPLPFGAIFVHIWLGWPIAIFLFVLVAAWLWFNPRAFPPPKSTDNWPSKVVLGERVWLNRRSVPISTSHAHMAILLSIVAGLGAVVALFGAVFAYGWMLVWGVTVMYFGKLWFCDRMVWLFDEMKSANQTYQSWLR